MGFYILGRDPAVLLQKLAAGRGEGGPYLGRKEMHVFGVCDGAFRFSYIVCARHVWENGLDDHADRVAGGGEGRVLNFFVTTLCR